MAETVSASRPTPEALAKVEVALEKEQQLAPQTPAETQRAGGGFGMGNALMMYWLLSGNRGQFAGGNGFRQAGGQVGNWQRGVESQRAAVSQHAAANPGYQRMVAQSRASGTPVRPGQAVRGGVGSTRSSGRSSFGS